MAIIFGTSEYDFDLFFKLCSFLPYHFNGAGAVSDGDTQSSYNRIAAVLAFCYFIGCNEKIPSLNGIAVTL